MGELTLYAYPWDVLDAGPAAFVEWAQARGVDRLAIATAYHSAEYVAPRAERNVHRVVEPDVAHVPLRPFTGPLSAPAGRLAVEHPELMDQLATAAGAAGLALTGWTVTLHNSALAGAHPDASLRNCFGDPSGHALCPANPDARRYGIELVAAVGTSGWFDQVMAESLSYLLVPHGHPHELSGIGFDLVTRTLLSLCFCPHCRQRGQERGIDVPRLAAWTAATLRERWNRVEPTGDAADLLGAIWGAPGLSEYLRMRCEVATELVAAATLAAGVELVPAGAGWARPAALGFLEGIDIGALPRSLLLPYYREPSDVARDLDFAASAADPTRVGVLQTLWPTHHPQGLDDLLAKIALAQARGFADFGMYNYASATPVTVDWLPAVAAQVHAS